MSLAGDFELMVWRSGWYQALGQKQGQIIVCGGHNGGHGNADRGNNSCNCRVSFLYQGESDRTPVPGIDGNNIDAECYYFHVPGDFSNNCSEVPFAGLCNPGAGGRSSGGRTVTGMCQIRVGLAHHDDGITPSTWLLLDTCSTSSFSKNPDIFKKIWEFLEQEILTVVTNGGNKAFNEIGKYYLFPIEAHFNLHSMANYILPIRSEVCS